MADIPFLVDINLTDNQLTNFRVQNLGVAPTALSGAMYFDTAGAINILKAYDGAAWQALYGDLGYVSSPTNGIITQWGSGADATIPLATGTNAGLLSPGDFTIIGNNSVDVTLVNSPGTYNYLTISGQAITLNQIDLTTDITGNLPVSRLNSGTGATGTTYWAGDGTWKSIPVGFSNFSVGGDTGADQIIASGDLINILGGTGINSTITDATTTTTITLDLENTGVSAATYGSATKVPVLTVDLQGRITAGSDATIAILESQITNLGTAVTLNADTTLVGNGWFLDDDTMSANDATKTVSQQSLVAYVGSEIAAAVTTGMDYKGGYNASTNTPALDTGTPSITIGDTYTVTAAGTFFTEPVEVGDVLIAEATSSDAASLTDWTILNKNLDGVVIGPASAVGNNFASFDLTTGKLIKDSGFNSSSFITTGGAVTSISGVTNRTTITGTATVPIVDISTAYVGQTSITTLGTISTGVWSGTTILGTKLQSASETIKGVSEEATNAEMIAGTSIGATGAKLFVAPDKLQTYLGISGTITPSVVYTRLVSEVTTTVVVTHNIGRKHVNIELFLEATGQRVFCKTQQTSTTTCTIIFNTAPVSNAYRIVVTG